MASGVSDAVMLGVAPVIVSVVVKQYRVEMLTFGQTVTFQNDGPGVIVLLSGTLTEENAPLLFRLPVIGVTIPPPGQVEPADPTKSNR
jgi:hypothetical protein